MEDSTGLGRQGLLSGTPLPRRIGDAAGEHLAMRRGRYGAWAYVVLAFLLQAGAATSLTLSALEPMARRLHLSPEEPRLLLPALGAGLLVALATFADRWRVVEAHASRFCSGLVNLSLLYVPFLAWGYANYRAALKLRGE